MILHPVQLVSLQTDQGRKIHEDPVDLDNLLLHPHHILMSEEGKRCHDYLSLKEIIQVLKFSNFNAKKCFKCKISWPQIAIV